MVISLNGENIKDRASASLLKMGEAARETLQLAVQALRNQDAELARKVMEQDDVIDNYQIVIEEEVSRLAAYEPATSMEYKRQMAMVKIASDLERIGDYASNIASVVLKIKNDPLIKPLIHIPQLAALAIQMLSAALQAFIEWNSDLAEAVCKRDDEADDLYELISEELVTIVGSGVSQKEVNQAIWLLQVAEWLERAADHATNIGEETVHIVTGKRIKY
jgi:phosphate transport system protein